MRWIHTNYTFWNGKLSSGDRSSALQDSGFSGHPEKEIVLEDPRNTQPEEHFPPVCPWDGVAQAIEPVHTGKANGLVDTVVIDQNRDFGEGLKRDGRWNTVVTAMKDIQKDQEGLDIPVLGGDPVMTIACEDRLAPWTSESRTEHGRS